MWNTWSGSRGGGGFTVIVAAAALDGLQPGQPERLSADDSVVFADLGHRCKHLGLVYLLGQLGDPFLLGTRPGCVRDCSRRLRGFRRQGYRNLFQRC